MLENNAFITSLAQHLIHSTVRVKIARFPKNMSNRRLVISFVCLVMVATGCSGDTHIDEHAKKKYTSFLPADYNRFEPPGDEVTVYIDVKILDVNGINEAEKFFGLDILLYMFWTDYRIDVDTAMARTYVPYRYADLLYWLPEVELDSLKDATLFETDILSPLHLVHHHYSAMVSRRRYSLKVNCPMQLALYPMDSHNCHLQVAPHISKKLKLMWITGNNNPRPDGAVKKPNEKIFRQVGGYVTTKVVKTESVGVVNYEPDISILHLNITFERRLFPTLIGVYFPSCLIVLISCISFWIKPEAVPGRISLGVFALLAIITQYLSVRTELPPLSYVTALDIWLLFNLLVVCSSLVEFALAYAISQEKLNKAKSGGGHLMLLNNELGSTSLFQMAAFAALRKMRPKKWRYFKALFNDVDKTSRVLYPVVLALFNFIYWTYYLSRRYSESVA